MSDEETVIEEVIQEPITEYDNYLTTDNKVFGIDNGEFAEIEGISDLFKIDGVIYFKAGKSFYSQLNGKITEIEASDYPAKQIGTHVELDGEKFEIKTVVYDGENTSRVFRDNCLINAYYIIDSYLVVEDVLYFTVAKDYGSRKKGAYILKSTGICIREYDTGRIW